MPTLSARLNTLHHHMHALRSAPMTSVADAQLIAVSKQQPDSALIEALAAGQRVFGENRVQEAQQHWSTRRTEYPDLQLHLIGPLQSNKAADAVALFDVIHTIDREKIARAVSDEVQRQNKSLSCLIQVNTGLESQKAGIAPHELADFIAFCRTETRLLVTGLMCIPPVDAPPSLHFLLLRKLANRHGLQHLSMGMSDDYELPLRCGATHIRVGSRLFGSRIPREASASL